MISIFFQENFDINLSQYVDDKIFKPLGIEKFIWNNIGEYCAGATGLFLNYKDFHKIGQLLLNFGKYKDIQVVPIDWIKQMISPQIECKKYFNKERVFPKIMAGYFTWISRDGIIFRDGSNGQYIIVDYNKKLLITIMSSEKDMSKVTECLRGLI